jgi:hypothetical protein
MVNDIVYATVKIVEKLFIRGHLMTYIEFINNILNIRGRFACGDEYHERHHIVPKCVGGSDDKENLIDLYAREHFIAHKLLALENPNDRKLQLAYICMSFVKNDNEHRYQLNEEEYEQARIACSIACSGENNPFYGNHSQIGKNHPRARAVYCPELDEVFWGAKEAQDKYGIHKASIAQCCKGKLNHTGSHPVTGEFLTWYYADATLEEIEKINSIRNKPHKNSKRVYSPELDMYFDSATKAATYLGITVGVICSCCNGDPKHQHAGKHPKTGELLTWIYV